MPSQRCAEASGAVSPAGSLRRLRGPAVVALSVAPPVLLLVGDLIARARQPPGTYDAVTQTLSTLAGRGATDRWLMAGDLALVGVLYMLVAAGLRGMPRCARLVLGLGGLAAFVAGVAAQPAHGSSSLHMVGTSVGAVAFVVWPLALAVDRTLDPRLRRGSLVAAGLVAGALGWLCAQAWTDGTWLGAAERVLILSQTVWPARVAVAAWRRDAGRPAPRLDAGWTTVGFAVLAPVVLVVGLLAAQAAQPTTDPLDRSLSALAGEGASSRWIMSGALVLAAVIYLLVAAGLRRRVPAPAWLLFGTGGAMLLVVALSPQPVDGYSPVHMLSAGLAWAAFTAWPLGLACSPAVAGRLRWTSAVATAVLLVLVGWFAVEFVTDGRWYGLSERIVVLAQAVWPIRVAAAAVRRDPGGVTPRTDESDDEPPVLSP